jgi:hypothetical protein
MTSTPLSPIGSATSFSAGPLPDAFEDDWIAAVLKDRSALLNFSQRVERTKRPMELRYNQDMDDHGLDWEYTERVLSSRDLDKWVARGGDVQIPARLERVTTW